MGYLSLTRVRQGVVAFYTAYFFFKKAFCTTFEQTINTGRGGALHCKISKWRISSFFILILVVSYDVFQVSYHADN